MSFVNAYVSDEDAKKYDLDNLWNKYRRFGTKMPELFTDLYPIQFAWEIVSMNPSNLPSMSKADLLTILKEALAVYKCSGIRDL
ncbi:hypothetical protein ACGH6Q_01195 [Gilliamella sp. BG2]|uniref:hypothetical protein n=1 Tax=Gilliamella sp. BG2 TaxID=3351509 RepID=UPI003986BF25